MAKQKTPAYTRSGDVGKSCLCGLSKKISKSTLRFDALGDIDELNSAIGVCRAFNQDKEIDLILKKLQENIFRIGTSIATAKGAVKNEICEHDLYDLERVIDRFHIKLPELKKFILPGGCPLATYLQFARAICRRAERKIVALNEKKKLKPVILSYINRMSSLLFVLARWANKQDDVKEAEWNP